MAGTSAPQNPISQKVLGALGGLTSVGGVTYVLITYIPFLHNHIPSTLLPLIPIIIGSAGTLFGGWKATHRVTPQELQAALDYAKSVYKLAGEGLAMPIIPTLETQMQSAFLHPTGPGGSPLLPDIGWQQSAHVGPDEPNNVPAQVPSPGPSDADLHRPQEFPGAEVTSGYPEPSAVLSPSEDTTGTQDTENLQAALDETGHDAG